MWEVSLTHPLLSLFLSGEFLLHIPCWLNFSVGSFSYTSHASFFFFFFFFKSGSFSHTSRAGFICIWGVSLTHPMPTLFLCRKFLLHILCWLKIFIWGVSVKKKQNKNKRKEEEETSTGCVKETRHIKDKASTGCVRESPCIKIEKFLSGEFLLHILCLLYFSVGSFSYTSHAGLKKK